MTLAPEGPVRRISALVIFCFLFLGLVPSFCSAQVASRWDVFGGFSARRFDSTTIGYKDYSYLYGWNAQGAINITLKFGAVLDLSGNYGSKLDVYNFMIGPQYSWRRDKSRFFVHGLFGKGQVRVNIPNAPPNLGGNNPQQPGRSYFESVGKAFGGGGGFDVDLSPRITVRVFQADFLRNDTFGANQDDFRVSGGLVFHFGHIGHRPKL